MLSNEILDKLINTLKMRSMKIATMESCTGGLLISTITDIEGSSAITDGGYVTYSNKSKVLNGVDKEIIDKYGVYSKETALAMAKACKVKNNSNIGIGITGTFGNIDENNKDSKIGVVYYAITIGTDNYTYEIEVPIESIKCSYSFVNVFYNKTENVRTLEKKHVIEIIILELCNRLGIS